MSNTFDIGSQLKQLAQLQQDGELSHEQYARAKAILLDKQHPQQQTMMDELYALLDLYDNDDLTDEEFEQAKASLLGMMADVKFKNAPQPQYYKKGKRDEYDEAEKAVKKKSTLYTFIRDLPDGQAKNKKLSTALTEIERSTPNALDELERKYKKQIYLMGFALLFLTPASLYVGLYVLISAINIDFIKGYAGAFAGLLLMALVAIPAVAAFGKLIQAEYLLRVVRAQQGHTFSIRWVYQFSGYLGFSVLLCGFCACSSTVWSGFRARDYVPSTPRATQTPLGGGGLQQVAISTATQKPAQPTTAQIQPTRLVASATKESASTQLPVVVASITPMPSNTSTSEPSRTPRPTNTMRPTAVSGQTTTEGVNARSCASTTCDVVKIVSSRDSFVITGAYDDWYGVEFADGKTAYIRGDFVVLPEGSVLPVGPTLTSTPRPTNTPKPTSRPRATATEFVLGEDELLITVKTVMFSQGYPIKGISRNGNEVLLLVEDTYETDEQAVLEYRLGYFALSVGAIVTAYEDEVELFDASAPSVITMKFQSFGVTTRTVSLNYKDARDYVNKKIDELTLLQKIRIR
jgi:hypothetical protein